MLLAILHGAAPSIVPFAPETGAVATLSKALEAARRHFGVDPMVDARDPHATAIETIMVTYLTELYLALPNVGKGVHSESSPTGRRRAEAPHLSPVRSLLGHMGYVDASTAASRGSPGPDDTPTRELEVDALRRRCYELEHAAHALPATLEKLRELQAYTKDLATQCAPQQTS